LATECDGEYWHLDEHGNLLIEDVDRQEVLERAGWKVLRIPYRSWQKNPDHHISRILKAFNGHGEDDSPNSHEGHVDSEAARIDESARVNFPQKVVIELVLMGNVISQISSKRGQKCWVTKDLYLGFDPD